MDSIRPRKATGWRSPGVNKTSVGCSHIKKHSKHRSRNYAARHIKKLILTLSVLPVQPNEEGRASIDSQGTKEATARLIRTCASREEGGKTPQKLPYDEVIGI